MKDNFKPVFILEKPFVSFHGSLENCFCLKISFMLIANTIHATFPALTLLQHPGSAGSDFAPKVQGEGRKACECKGSVQTSWANPDSSS